MEKLSKREKELVAIGSAMGSNCVPCIEYHIPYAKKTGLTDEEILEAIEVAQMVKSVPAEKILKVARELLKSEKDACTDVNCSCRQ